MGMIQIRNVPDDVHTALKVRAAREGLSLSELLLREISALAARPSWDEMIARVRAAGAPGAPTPTSEEIVAAVRATRDEFGT